MTPFAQIVQEWNIFYATIAGSSATLVGLLFVALTLNPNTLSRSNNSINKLLAWQIFTNFVFLIGIAFTFLIPEQTPLGLGLPLLFVGIIGLANCVLDIRTIYNSNYSAPEKSGMIRRSAFRALAMTMLIAVAVFVTVGSNPSILWWMIAPILALLISASTNTWVLLVAVQEASTKA